MAAEAASNGHLAVVQWADRNGLPLTNVVKVAAYAGQLAVLQWTQYAASYACSHRSGLAILKWAHATGLPWFGHAVNACALYYGNAEILQWAHSLSLPGCKSACRSLLRKKHLLIYIARTNTMDGLEWASEQGMFSPPLDLRTLKVFTGWIPYRRGPRWTHTEYFGKFSQPEVLGWDDRAVANWSFAALFAEGEVTEDDDVDE